MKWLAAADQFAWLVELCEPEYGVCPPRDCGALRSEAMIGASFSGDQTPKRIECVTDSGQGAVDIRRTTNGAQYYNYSHSRYGTNAEPVELQISTAA